MRECRSDDSKDDLEVAIAEVRRALKPVNVYGTDDLEAAIAEVRKALKPVNVLELAEPDMMTMDAEEFKEVDIELALDSGAVDHVMNKLPLPEYCPFQRQHARAAFRGSER